MEENIVDVLPMYGDPSAKMLVTWIAVDPMGIVPLTGTTTKCAAASLDSRERIVNMNATSSAKMVAGVFQTGLQNRASALPCGRAIAVKPRRHVPRIAPMEELVSLPKTIERLRNTFNGVSMKTMETAGISFNLWNDANVRLVSKMIALWQCAAPAVNRTTFENLTLSLLVLRIVWSGLQRDLSV